VGQGEDVLKMIEEGRKLMNSGVKLRERAGGVRLLCHMVIHHHVRLKTYCNYRMESFNANVCRPVLLVITFD
jgi:hypothetical protein